MAELVDALDSKSGGSNTVRVQVPPRPPDPDFFQNRRASARFLLPSVARSKGENGPQVRGSGAHFRPPLPPLLVRGNGGFYYLCLCLCFVKSFFGLFLVISNL